MIEEREEVVLYGDYACPYSYLAESVVAALRAQDVAVARRGFELRPPGSPLVLTWPDGIEALAGRFGVELNRPPRPVRTRKAHEAAMQAGSRGMHEAMHAAIFRAYFVEGRDIGRIDVLATIAGEIGLDASEMRVVLDVDRWADNVVADRERALALGIDATPVFAIGGRVLTGLDEPARMVERVRRALEETGS